MNRLFKIAALLVLAMPLLGLPSAAQSGLRPIVVDKTGKVLGPVIVPDPYGDHVRVGLLMDSEQVPVQVTATRDGIPLATNFEEPGPYWLDFDCKGQPYVSSSVPLRAGYSGDPAHRDTLYFPDTTAIPIVAKPYSTYHNFRCRNNHGYSRTSLVPARPVTIGSLGFTPPFRIELR